MHIHIARELLKIISQLLQDDIHQYCFPAPDQYVDSQVPYRLKKSFNKIQQRLVRELEKKFSGKDVVLIANRRIMPPQKGASNKRPRSRTLTAVSSLI